MSNMNFIDACGVLADSVEVQAHDKLALEAREVIRAVVDASDSLEPTPEEWKSAPWATHCIMLSGALFFTDGDPVLKKSITGFSIPGYYWSYDLVARTEFLREVDIPLGVDWRLCKWKRPEVTP